MHEDTWNDGGVRILVGSDPAYAQHPSSHGGLTVEIDDDGAVDVVIGNVHRSAEKLFESRDYRQAMMLADRHDWTSPFTSELGLAITVERALGIAVPARAARLRTLLSEMSRLGAAMAFLDGFAQQRERLFELFAAYSGQRIHLMAARIGGLAFDASEEWLDLVRAFLADEFDTGAVREWARAHQGVGVLHDAASYGVSGPVARAAGIGLDARFDDPYDGYPIGARLPVSTASDVAARFASMCDSLDQSVALARSLVDEMPDGPISVKLPKVVKVPEGTYLAATESAIGVNRYYLVSEAKRSPLRLKIRSASFNNASALASALHGVSIDQVSIVIRSFFLVPGDIDR